MNRSSPDSSAERTGRRIGRVWRRMMRFQNACRRALIRVGLPVGAANSVIAAVWIIVVAAFVRYGLWVWTVAALAFVLVLAGVADVPNSVEQEHKWRMGYMGFGLYNADGFRVDPHDPDKNP